MTPLAAQTRREATMSEDLIPIKVPEETPFVAFRFLKDITVILARLAEEGLDIPPHLFTISPKDDENVEE